MYITLNQFATQHPWPTLSGIRSLYHKSRKEKNKFLEAFSKVGKRLLVCPDKFFRIVEENASKV